MAGGSAIRTERRQTIDMDKKACKHDELVLTISDFGLGTKFKRASDQELAAAATGDTDSESAAPANGRFGVASTFPAPLVLPDDLLAVEEDDDPQSLQGFLHYADRNEPTNERKTIYLMDAPEIDKSVSFMRAWSEPLSIAKQRSIQTSKVHLSGGILQYISAFYHGMPVKRYKTPVKFVAQEHDTSTTPNEVDMLFNGQLLGIRTRPCPDYSFARQLNLNDLIDVLINLLPADAYAILMLVDQDIWEDDEDDFTCGRAYGASRVALVSTARYNPDRDIHTMLETQHAWPASHCHAYTSRIIANFEAQSIHGKIAKKQKTRSESTHLSSPSDSTSTSPMRAAVNAFRQKWLQTQTEAPSSTTIARNNLWLSRVCKTVSHELGHCIGIDHCSYYACVMQGTSSMQEDARQPPYLCPVDEAKLLATTKAASNDRDQALLEMLGHPGWRDEPTFAAYAAWIDASRYANEDDSIIYLGSSTV